MQTTSEATEARPLNPNQDIFVPPSGWRRAAQAAATGVINAGIYTGIAHSMRYATNVTYTPTEEIAYYVPPAVMGLASGILSDLYISPPSYPWNTWSWREHIVSTIRATLYPQLAVQALVGFAFGSVPSGHVFNPAVIQWTTWISSGLAAATTLGLTVGCCKRPQMPYAIIGGPQDGEGSHRLCSC